MKKIYKIIELIISEKTIVKIINDLGVLIKVIGHIHVLNPLDDEIKNIGLVIKDNKILSAGIILSEPITFKDLTDEISNHFKWGYNHYDEETVVNFQVNENIFIRAIKEGYIEENSLINVSFRRFEIDLK